MFICPANLETGAILSTIWHYEFRPTCDAAPKCVRWAWGFLKLGILTISSPSE